MLELIIPQKLKIEFATVEAIFCTSAETRRVDSLMLCWVKYEKQLRRLFCFLIFQHPNFKAEEINKAIEIISKSNRIYPETFINGIQKLGVRSIPDLLGNSYAELWSHILRIKKYRNKIMHGQLTGLGISATQLEQDVVHLIQWVSSLADAADSTFGYDGLRRNTYIAAKKNAVIVVENYPFDTPAAFDLWLAELSR